MTWEYQIDIPMTSNATWVLLVVVTRTDLQLQLYTAMIWPLAS
jgi:hypothetical protein